MAKEKKQVERITDMEVDFAKWYTDVCTKAELIDYTSTKGMFILRPYGYAIWENIQKELDADFKRTGHTNVSMPMLIPESPAPEGEGSCVRLCSGVCLGHPWRQRKAGGAAVHPSYLRDAVLRPLEPHCPLLERSAPAV